MLLKYIDTYDLCEADANKFFEENEREVMSIYSQYMTMYEDEIKKEGNDRESIENIIGVLTISYLRHGTQTDVPDRKVRIPKEMEIEIKNKFFTTLLNLIIVYQSCSTLVKEGLFEAKKIKGKTYFSITKRGNEFVESLDSDKLENNT